MRSSPTIAFVLAAVLATSGLWPTPASAKIDVEVKGVEQDVRKNVLIFLGLQRYRSSNDLPPDMVERLYQRADREVRQALKPFGFYTPKVAGSLKRAGNGRDWRVVLNIDPGPPVMVTSVEVKITGPGEERRSLKRIVDSSTLKEGQRLNHGAYDKLKGDLQRQAVSIGYLDATLTRNELVVDPPNLTASAAIELKTGERYKFGKTTIEQNAVDPQLAARFLRYKEGANFSGSALLRSQFALDDSLYFSNVEVVPGARDPKTLTVPVDIRAQTARKNTYSVGLGYGTDTRARGTVGWDNRRVNTAGHRLHVGITAADLEQSLEGRYSIPVGDPVLEKLSFDSAARREKLADLDVQTFEIIPGLTQIRGRWQRVISVSASHETTDSLNERQSDLLLIPGISFARLPANFRGDALSLTNGFFVKLSGSHSAFGSGADFLRLHVQDERLFDLSRRWHVLLRGEMGLSAVAGFSDLPGSQRFFAGGDRSVRGFGYNELSPEEPVIDQATGQQVEIDGVPQTIKTGGRYLVVGSVEVVRDLPRNFGVAVFVDAGNAMNKLGDKLEYAAGIGFRWRLPVVTVGIDVAQALSRSDMKPHFHLNISPQL